MPQIVQIRRLLKKKPVLASPSQPSYQADLSKPIIGAGLLHPRPREKRYRAGAYLR